MKKIKVAINGFGRIGRAFYKIGREREELDIVAVNDIGDIHNMAYLLKYDTVYGKSGLDVEVAKDAKSFIVNGAKVLYLSEKEPAKLPWKDLGVDVVVESTGLFTSAEKAKAHLDGGAKRVIVTAPIKDAADAVVKGTTILMGLNDHEIAGADITSNASCTTNAASPLIAILDSAIGVEKALLNTVHAYTASQSLVDGPAKKDWREGRSAAQNIVPSSTGAAIATTKVIRSLEGKFDGISLRVPVVTGSIVDITFISKRSTTAEEVNNILKTAAKEEKWKGIFTITEEQLVSHDIIGDRHASIADLAFTRVVGGNLVKVLAWYDNEVGYTHTLVRHVIEAGKLI
jgi:glyceraldehyde 3-phosphate dehydrogenase